MFFFSFVLLNLGLGVYVEGELEEDAMKCSSVNIFSSVTNLTFDRPSKFVDFENRMCLCLKENKRQRKDPVNCASGMPDKKVTTRCVGVRKIYNNGIFRPLSSGQRTVGKERGRVTKCHAVLGSDPAWGQTVPCLEVVKSLNVQYSLMLKASTIAEENKRA